MCYGFQGKCGEYVKGFEIHPRQIHFSCPKLCKGITVSKNVLGDIKNDLCESCAEQKANEPPDIYSHKNQQMCKWFGSKRCAVNDLDADCDTCDIYEEAL